MHKRSTETRNLLNPAFCGLIYASIVDGYNSKSEGAIPFYLLYILMPIVLHKESRQTIPKSSLTKFLTWIQQSEQIKIGLPERAISLKPFVSEAAIFLHGQGHIESDQKLGIRTTNTTKIKNIVKKSESIKEYTRKAKTLGAMCGKNNSDLSILALLGVRL
jgi:ABC-three component (ABC-3C) system Middle Component 3